MKTGLGILGSIVAGLIAVLAVRSPEDERDRKPLRQNPRRAPRGGKRQPRVSQGEGAPYARDLRDLVGLKRSAAHSLLRQRLALANVQPDQPYRLQLAALMTSNLFGWVADYLKYRIGPKHPFATYPAGDGGVYALTAGAKSGDAPIRMSIAGDWGTGTEEAAIVAAKMEEFKPHYTIHLGDVYYVGDGEEVLENCLGEGPPDAEFTPVKWPDASVARFAMNGNHEMYANGDGYFNNLLPRFGFRMQDGQYSGQKTSFFCLQNDHWRVLGLDTGYRSVGVPVLEQIPLINRIPYVGPNCDLRQEEVEWLNANVSPSAGHRATVILTHHQPFSSFEDWYPRVAVQLGKFFRGPVLWLWGHEHRFAVYGKFSIKDGPITYGRCLGHGGMPISLCAPKPNSPCPLVAYDNRIYQTFGEESVGFNGFANLTFEGNRLKIEHLDLHGTALLTEHWQVSPEGELSGTAINGSNLLEQVQPLRMATH